MKIWSHLTRNSKISYKSDKKVRKLDYDIDKAYIMGLSFDGNGIYVGWSNLFDYSSELSITDSEDLPMPRKIKYTISSDGFNIDPYIELIKDNPRKIKVYAKLLNYLYKNDIKTLTFSDPYGEEVIKLLNLHEFTNIPNDLKEDSNKNFISSHILSIVQNPRNMIAAYSPIEMEDFREASNNSPKGEQSSNLTLLNPATKLLMLIQNITGKNVIGIAANGEKASFMWHYYINDIFRKTNNIKEKIKAIDNTIDIDKYLKDEKYRLNYKDNQLLIPINELIDKLNYVKFNFTTNRIANRSKGEPIEQLVTTLPDINLEEIDLDNIPFLLYRLTGDITVDLMISLVLSAATDFLCN